jgi:hypothetical protein
MRSESRPITSALPNMLAVQAATALPKAFLLQMCLEAARLKLRFSQEIATSHAR